MKELGKYSVGTGDRFGREGAAQIAAVKALAEAGVKVDIVWNKSKREHLIVGSKPEDQRAAADAAVKETAWLGSYFVDADHINSNNVAEFIDYCDFFTIDVADFIGKKANANDIAAFLAKRGSLVGKTEVPGLEEPLVVSTELLRSVAEQYVYAIKEAGVVYRTILNKKGAGNFITEVSMDEAEAPQTPSELYLVLAALADEGVPVNTIAPKFSGRFNKGVDYVGDVKRFMKEFKADVRVVNFAAAKFGLPVTLKLSVHSGSDKFLLYEGIARILKETGAGLHLKTAGTTWLEELIGLAESGGEGLRIAKEVYYSALNRYDELIAPYLPVVDIDTALLPSAETVEGWTGADYAAALRHDQTNKRYNLHFRQLLHVAYKIAAEMGERYFNALDQAREPVERNVRVNLFERHFRPLFLSLH